RSERRPPGLSAIGRQMRHFATEAFRSFLCTRGAFGGLLFALLPAGAVSLGLALQSNLAVEVGMSDDDIAWLSLWSQVIAALCMVLGGQLSDRYGRRRTLFVYIALMSLPVLYLMGALIEHQWIMPVGTSGGVRRVAPAALVTAVWVATLTYAVAQGLMYGTRSAAMMDVTNPVVAATQFTAYMALMNLAIAYSATWQGIAAEAIGYPKTLLIDALIGLLCLALIPMLRPDARGFVDGRGSGRARALAAVLAIGCLAWVPYRAGLWNPGTAAPIVETLFTLIFIASAVFLAAGAAVLAQGNPMLARAGLGVAPLLLATYARRWFPDPAWVYDTIAVVSAVVLAAQAMQDWPSLGEEAGSAQAASA
ncbi:MAG: hypothetical protein ABIX12_05190, partial [Rubrivivax sp.]